MIVLVGLEEYVNAKIEKCFAVDQTVMEPGELVEELRKMQELLQQLNAQSVRFGWLEAG